MSLLGNLTVGILGNMSGLSGTFKDAKSEVQKFGKSMESVGRDLSNVGSSMTAMVTVPLVTLGGSSLKAAIDFESAFAGVRKTVDATEAEFATFKQGFRDMAKEIPVAATEIAAVGEAAGQLGIKNEAILGFIRTMVDLGVATNMSSDEAATALARLANITQMPQSEFDRLGSTIVALGNNLATTESEIVEMGLRLAGAGKQVGMTEAEILSFAGALSSVGIEAEAGGSAFSKVMVNMQLAAEKGGKDLDNFAKVAGMSSKDFQKAFKEDASGAMIAFIEGLATAENRGLSAIGILDEMGITEVRMRDSLLRAAGASNVFADAIELGSTAWDENIALTNEANERYKTTESQLKIFWNRIKDIGITLGDVLIPALLAMLDVLSPGIDMIANIAEWFSKLDPAIQGVTIAIAAIAAAIGPFLAGLGFILTNIGGLITSLSGLSGVFAALTGPVGLIILAIAGLGVALVALWKNSETFRENVIGIFNKVKDVAVQAFGVIASFVGEKIAQIKQFWDENGTQFLTAVENVFNGIMAVVNFVMPAIKFIVEMVWTAIKQVIDGALNVIMGLIKVFSGLFTGDFSKMWEGIKQIFFGAIDLIIGWMTLTFVGGIRALLTNLVKLGVNLVKNLSSGILNVFKGLKSTGVNLAKGLVDGVLNFFRNLQLSVQLIFNSIRSTGASIWTGIRDTIVNIAKIIWDLVASRFTSMVSSIRNIFGTIRGVVSGIWSNVMAFFRSIQLFGVARTIINGFISGIRATMNTIRGVVSGIWSNVMSFFRGINLTSIGRDIIRGLINGIGSMASAVWDKAKSIAEGIGNSIRKVLKLASPSKLMIQFGKWVGEGLAIGMEDMIRLVTRMAEDLGIAAIPDVPDVPFPDFDLPDDPFGGGGSGGRGQIGSGGITQNITIISPEPTSPSDNARKMKQASQQLAMEWGV